MRKTAVLTIDDGPSSLTGELVEFLKGTSIPAVMFFRGDHIASRMDVAIEALRAGMVLGNHSYSHRSFSSLSLAEAEQEVGRTEALLDAVHQKAGIPRLQRLFRFPYGDKGGTGKAALAQMLARLGFDRLDTAAVTYPWFAEHGLDTDLDVFWTYDYDDYKLTQPHANTSWADLMDRLDEAHPPLGGSLVSGQSAEVILLHDHPHTEAFHPGYYRTLIQETMDRGVSFVASQVTTMLPRL